MLSIRWPFLLCGFQLCGASCKGGVGEGNRKRLEGLESCSIHHVPPPPHFQSNYWRSWQEGVDNSVQGTTHMHESTHFDVANSLALSPVEPASLCSYGRPAENTNGSIHRSPSPPPYFQPNYWRPWQKGETSSVQKIAHTHGSTHFETANSMPPLPLEPAPQSSHNLLAERTKKSAHRFPPRASVQPTWKSREEVHSFRGNTHAKASSDFESVDSLAHWAVKPAPLCSPHRHVERAKKSPRRFPPRASVQSNWNLWQEVDSFRGNTHTQASSHFESADSLAPLGVEHAPLCSHHRHVECPKYAFKKNFLHESAKHLILTILAHVDWSEKGTGPGWVLFAEILAAFIIFFQDLSSNTTGDCGRKKSVSIPTTAASVFEPTQWWNPSVCSLPREDPSQDKCLLPLRQRPQR
ncbi:hypothetical protein RB195_021889 [Necator americanus]|uniref:Uncharacterized protein n=1 Tax=Necator americanus TaxID=51031 RepID=A0ABR1ED21_NECAM